MGFQRHIRLLIVATLVWAGFLVGGFPSYYQQFSTRFLVGFDIVVLSPIAGTVYWVLRGVARNRRLRVSLWLAFYFTVPLAIYDWIYCWIYCGLHLGHGLGYVGRFRYLSVYYVIPWILFPLLAVGTRSERSGRSRNAETA